MSKQIPIDAHGTIFSFWILDCRLNHIFRQISLIENFLDIDLSQVLTSRENNIGFHYLSRGCHAQQFPECLKILWVSNLRANRAAANTSVSLSEVGVFCLLNHLLDWLLSPLEADSHDQVWITFIFRLRGWRFWGLFFRRGQLRFFYHFALYRYLLHAWIACGNRGFAYWGGSWERKLAVKLIPCLAPFCTCFGNGSQWGYTFLTCILKIPPLLNILLYPLRNLFELCCEPPISSLLVL